MTHPQNPHPSLQSTVDHARRLTEPGHAQAGTPAWVAQAHHVGDLSVLALALRG
jgi:phosphohistidine phosphatase SixA